MNSRVIRVISWLVVIIWMLVIFHFSSEVKGDSNNTSLGVTEMVVNMIEKMMPSIQIDVDNFNHIVRKLAHFSIYLVLGILVMNAMRLSGMVGVRFVYVALLICVVYAVSDEIHQMFVPGRGPQFRDVLIDSSGAVVGIGIYFGVSGLVRRVRGNVDS